MGLESLTQKITRKVAIGLIGSALALGSLGLNGCYSIGYSIGKSIRQQLPRNQNYFFACNYWEDLNHNGALEYPTEFVGIKSVFRDTEEITLVGSSFLHEMGKTCKIDILSPKGDLVERETYVFVQSGEGLRKIFSGDEVKALVSKFGHGTYKVIWYVNNQVIANIDFAIVPSE